MKRGCLIALAVPVVAVAALIASYPLLYPTYVVRYRLTVNTVVGDQPHSGSSVVEIRVKRQPQWISEMPPWQFNTSGEATFVDLGEGRNLVALLNPGPSEGKDCVTILFRAFQVPFLVERAADLKNLNGERRLQPDDWPPFVTFQNVNDPLSVKPVKPSAMRDNYGVDARIESVTLAIAQDAVTRGLDQKLPWLASPLSDSQLRALSKINFARVEFIGNGP